MKGRIKRNPEEGKLILPRIGFIKTGMKNASGYPQSVDYFIPTGKYANLFTQEYGDKPKTIQVVFISDDPFESCSERYELRDHAGKLYASGDGEEFQVWNGAKYEKRTPENVEEFMAAVVDYLKTKSNNNKFAPKWAVTMSLRFIIPRIKAVAGHWEYSTRAVASSIPNIRNTFDALLESKGFIKGIIFDLNVDFVKSQKPDDKSRYPVVQLVPNMSQQNIDLVKGSLFNQGQYQLE